MHGRARNRSKGGRTRNPATLRDHEGHKKKVGAKYTKEVNGKKYEYPSPKQPKKPFQRRRNTKSSKRNHSKLKHDLRMKWDKSKSKRSHLKT